MKLTKEDYMRLPKERLAELLVEMDSHPIEPIVIPAQPTSPSVTECSARTLEVDWPYHHLCRFSEYQRDKRRP